MEKIIERSVYDLTVFKVHFSKLTLAERVRAQKGRAMASHAARKAAYDLHKLRQVAGYVSLVVNSPFSQIL
ncbi:MAG TPA: hypothetical protein VGK65_09295 [Candidatus Binatia bacterium]